MQSPYPDLVAALAVVKLVSFTTFLLATMGKTLKFMPFQSILMHAFSYIGRFIAKQAKLIVFIGCFDARILLNQLEIISFRTSARIGLHFRCYKFILGCAYVHCDFLRK